MMRKINLKVILMEETHKVIMETIIMKLYLQRVSMTLGRKAQAKNFYIYFRKWELKISWS